MGRLVHFEIHADDVDRAERFYTTVFGWTVQRWEGASMDYRLVTTGPPEEQPGIDGALMKLEGPSPAEDNPISAFACTVQVDDLATTTERISAAGGRRVTDPQDIPGVGRFAYFKDTEGNVVGALQPAPQEAQAASGGAGEQAGAS
jgi:predicted enzyme related to lactoylglutathione lyase